MAKYDVVIIGGGASGMMAGIWAAKNNQSAIIVEKNPELGRKILATGNGRCNLTNKFTEKSHYHGASPEFVEGIINQFNQYKIMEFFESLGLILKEENNGRMFPRNDQAQSVAQALKSELEDLDVTIKLNSVVRGIEKDGDFKIKIQGGEIISADKIIIAVGGKAHEQLGTSGDGYYWLEKLGHKIIPTHQALVPIETVETWPTKIQGLKIEGKAMAIQNGKILVEKQGDILFTHYGLSGPATMALAREIKAEKNIQINIDLYPEFSENELDKIIQKNIENNGKKALKNSIVGMAPNNLIDIILANLKIDPNKKAAEISKIDRQKIANILKNIQLTVKSLRPFREAQVTAGGVDTKEINPKTLESKIIPGLYFTGEIMDVDGDSGGFNLQWAWSTGFVAGNSAN